MMQIGRGETTGEEVATMKHMEDKEFFQAALSKPLFGGGSPDVSNCPSTKISASYCATAPLNRVADPELREIMETVLAEDADLISYLRHR